MLGLLINNRVVELDHGNVYILRRNNFSIKLNHKDDTMFSSFNADVSPEGMGTDVFAGTKETEKKGAGTLMIEVKAVVNCPKNSDLVPIVRIGTKVVEKDGHIATIDVMMIIAKGTAIVYVRKLSMVDDLKRLSDAFTNNTESFQEELSAIAAEAEKHQTFA